MRNLSRISLAVLAAACSSSLAANAPSAPPAAATLTQGLLDKAPVVDGHIEATEWAGAAVFDGFARDGKLQQRRVRAYVAATADHLHVAVRSQLPDEGKLVAKIDRDSLKAVFDDAVEVFVNPTPLAAARVDYQFLVNTLGRGGYAVHSLGGAKADPAWRGGWRHAHGFHDGAWQMECTIPIASMPAAGAGRKATDGVWQINLTRDWKQPWEWSSLGGEGGAYTFSGMRFRFTAGAAPVSACVFDGDPVTGRAGVRLLVRNPGKGPLPVTALLSIVRNNMPELRQEAGVTLASGKTKTLELKLVESDPTKHYTLHARVRSADGKTTYYDRRLAWSRGQALRWVAGSTKPPPPLDFRYAYYPYANRMRLLADVTGLAKSAKLDKVVAEVRERLTGKVVTVVEFPAADFRDGRLEKQFDLPPLAGLYEIALRAQGTGTPDGEVVKHFERKVFPWEHTPAGRSTKVYPPFEPIRLTRDGQTATVHTVLRAHKLGPLGLWDQVTCTSSHTGRKADVLAAPMRYVVRAGGKAVAVEAQGLHVPQAKPHVLRTQGGFHAGPLRVACRHTWDYDGTMKVALTLQPTGGKTVDELALEIPFRDEAAPLIHANADRIRAPVAQRVPAGQGVVWDASKVATDDYPHNFCPYVYVGSAVRGLCWFAENPAGWSWRPDTPNVTLVRDGETVTLRVHLINKPVAIDRPRKIVFGLLAAPVKPRLVAPDTNPNWWRYRYWRDRYTLLGTDINWLSPGTCGSVYPAGKDLYLWEMIRRGNREKLPRGVIEQVVEHGRRYFEPYGKGALATWRAHVHHNLTSRYGQKMVFYYNRASYQAAEEFETFKDEWCLTDFRSIGKGRGKGEIKIVPSESYIDHAVYWYARSFEIGGNQGVYWDNFFIAPSFNTAMTDAYREADGSIVPAAGIWQQRELARRTFVMMNERGMRPITFPHMTSFAPLPMLAFCTVQYDWEWKYSLGDVQDRHTRELILLTGTGELAGTWPVPLGDHGKLANDVWTQRTFTAVRILHELDGYGGCGLGYNRAHKQNLPLLKPILALLDQPGLRVHRYWDEGPKPADTGDDDLPVITYIVPGKEAVVAVVSYAPGDKTCRLTLYQKGIDLPGPWAITDAETGQPMSADGITVTFALKKHDIRVLRIRPSGPGAGAPQ